MSTYINEFLHRYNYPTNAKEELFMTYQQVKESSQWKQFKSLVSQYEEEKVEVFQKIKLELEYIANEVNLNVYSLNLIYLICISKHLWEIYQDLHWSEEMYEEAMFDLKYSMIECYRMHRIWGNCKIEWEYGFFELKRVAFGRLQYEMKEFDRVYRSRENELKPKDLVVNLWIPSAGPLTQMECEKSFAMAAEFFKKEFPTNKIPFVCSSWLLFSVNKRVLPEDSNIVQFIQLFDIYEEKTDEKNHELWRVFYSSYQNAPKDLPRDTTLQRAYADWLQSGHHLGIGHGIYFYSKQKYA